MHVFSSLRSIVYKIQFSFWLNTFFTIGRHALRLTLSRYLTDAIIIDLYNEVENTYITTQGNLLIKSLQYNLLSLNKAGFLKRNFTGCLL